MPDVAVIGGGIIGLSTALNLARAGSSVTLLEARRLAAMASGWTLGGVRQSGRDPAELPLARAAVEMWQTLGEDLDGDVEYRQRGNLRLARTEAEVETIRSMVASQADLGLKLDLLLGNAAVRAVAPALAPTVLAASFCPTDGHANPVKTAHCLAAAARRAGAVIREGSAVEHIVTSGGRVTGVATADGIVLADRVVIAAGVHAPELLAPLHVDLPMQPMIVSVLQTVPVPSAFEQVFGVANADCAGRQEVDGRLRITTGIGGWPNRLAGWRQDDLQPDGRTVAEMIRRVGAVLPIVETAGVAQVWGGLIDLTPDALPVIDAPEEVEGLVIAAGFSGHGFGIGPMVGRLVAELSLGQPTSLPLDAFRVARFRAPPAAQAALTLHG